MIMHCVMCTGPDLFLPHTRTEPGMGQEGTWPDRRVRYVIIPYEFSYHFLNDTVKVGNIGLLFEVFDVKE